MQTRKNIKWRTTEVDEIIKILKDVYKVKEDDTKFHRTFLNDRFIYLC